MGSFDATSDHGPVDRLAEEFVSRHRRGEDPSLSEYVGRYPEWADEIRELFPALLMMERLKPASDELSSHPPGGAGEAGRLPERLGDYRILREVGRGGMGVVYEAVQEALGRHVALKDLKEGLKDRPELVRRFVEEAQIGGQLQHPGIVPIYELGTFADRRPFFSMKLVKGRTLAAILAERQPGDGPRLLVIFHAIAQTMAYAHTRGVIHRDLKPSNVMVGSFGEVQVMDWGLAK